MHAFEQRQRANAGVTSGSCLALSATAAVPMSVAQQGRPCQTGDLLEEEVDSIDEICFCVFSNETSARSFPQCTDARK